MPCLIVHPGIIKLHSELKSETLASVKNMVGIWQEREIALGVPGITPESLPSAKALEMLYDELRKADDIEISLTKEDFNHLMDGKNLPSSLVDLGKRLGIHIAVNRKNHTIQLSKGGASDLDFRLFKALAVDLVYAGDEVAENAFGMNSEFGMSARERLQAIMDYERANRKAKNHNVDIMNYELQHAKRVLRDNYGISDDGIMEAYRKQAAESFTSLERMERISEITDWFDRMLTEKHEERLEELADRREDLKRAIAEKDTSLYSESAGIKESLDAKQRLLATKLSDLGISVRLDKFLKDKKLETVADIVQYNRASFAKSFNPSSAVLKEIVTLVDALGLKFGMDTAAAPSVSWEAAEAAYNKELGDIQSKLDSATRLKTLEEVTPQAIFNEIQQKFADLASIAGGNEAEFIDALHEAFPETSKNFIKKNIAWYRDQVKKVVDNFPVLREEACRELETSEQVRINISLDLSVDTESERMHDNENSDGEEDGDVNGIENQYKENWMYEYDTTSNWSKMSARVRHMLYKCPLSLGGSKRRRTRFGTQYNVPVMQVINTLIQEMQGITNSVDMELALEYMENDYPWTRYIREQISQDSRLKTELFRSIRRYAQSLGILKKSSEDSADFTKSRLNIINSGNTANSIMTSAKKQIASGFPVNKRLSIYDDRDINLDKVDDAIEILEKYIEFDRYKNPVSDVFTSTPDEVSELLKEKPELIDDLHQVLTAMGFVITAPDIRMVAARDVRKGIRQKNNLGVILAEAYHALKLIKGNEYESVSDLLEEPEYLTSDNKAMSNYTEIAKVLTLADRGTVEASKRENGKVRYSYVLPSVLDDLITGFQGKKFSREKSRKAGKRVNMTTREFIEKKYGRDPRFAYVSEDDGKIHYRNYVLETLAYGKTGISGNGISYVTILNVDTASRDKTEQKDLTQNDRLNMLWSMYHQGENEYLNAQGTWYPIPLPSDSGRMAYIRFTDIGEEARHETIKDEILKELERMTDPSYSEYDEAKEKDNPVYSHVPLTLRKNKSKFCTFPVLNDSDLVSDLDPAHLDGYSVSGLVSLYQQAQETEQFSELNDMVDNLATVVERVMVEKFKEENPGFYQSRVKESGEDAVDGFIMDQSLFQMGINEILNGDPAYYTGYNKGSDNIQKRAKQEIVPLDHLDIYNADFLEEYRLIHDIDPEIELDEDDIVENVLYIEDPVIPSPSFDDIKMLYEDALANGIIDQETFDMVMGGFSEIKYTDGQSFRSFRSVKMMMYGLGEMKKGDELDQALDRIASGNQHPEDSYIVRTAFKPFLSGLVPFEEGDGAVRLIPVQHKLSEQVLTAALVQASKTRLGKSNALSALSDFMEEEQIDAAIFTSGVKAGQNGAVNFGDVDVESASKEEIIAKMRDELRKYRSATGVSLVHQIPLSLWGIVAQNPDTGMDDDIPIAVQLQKLISADLPDTVTTRSFVNGQWVTFTEKAVYHVEGIGDLTRDEIVAMYNKLMTEKILRGYKEVTGIFADKKQLSEALRRSCRNSSRNSAYLERAFSLDEYGNFVIPLCDLATLNMSSEFLNSIVKNAVSRITMPGKSLVSMSAFGVAKDLKIEFEYDENGRPIRYKSIPCLLPAWSRPIVEKCIDEEGYIDISKLEKESPRLVYLIGLRIPLQFKNFILPLKCVGFLPTILGDSIVTAIDNIPLLDSDFDNDKIPTMFPSFTAQYMIDNWEDKAFEDYKSYTNRFYDYDKLHDDYYEYVGIREHEGIDDGNYKFSDFIQERLGDEEYEKQYRRKDAPEGKPMAFWEFKELHKSDYLRPDGPKLVYTEFDPNVDISKQSNGAIDNALISVMIGMLTSEAVSTMSLALGSPDKFDPIIRDLEKISPKGRYSAFDGPADISTRISQETKNNDGKQMISVFANAEAMQAILQHTDVGLVSGVGATINGRTLESLHEVQIEDSLEYISRYIGTSIGASADNAKKPRLSTMNINLRTAPVASLMLQLGYTMREVAFFLNIPSIRHFTDTGDFGKYRSKSDTDLAQELPGDLSDMARAIHFGDRYEDMGDDLREYNETALSVFLYLSEVGERLRMLSSLVRGDSGGTRPHGPIEENLVRLLNVELFAEMERDNPIFSNWEQVIKYSYEQEVSEDEVNNAKNPIAQAYITYGVVGAFRELEKYYPGIGDPSFRYQIKNIIKKYYNGVATTANVKNVLYSLYNYIESSYDCMRKDDITFEESRNYYLNIFPEEAAQIVSQYPAISGSLLFRRLKLYSALDSEEDPFIVLDYEGTMLPETRDEISSVWQQLFYAKDENGKPNLELRELALDLFKYCYFRNGFRFGNGTFAHLAPAEARLMFPGYAEMLDDMLENPMNISGNRFEMQFVRNNLYDRRFCQTLPQGADFRKPDNWWVNNTAAKSVSIPYRSKMDEVHRKAFDWYFAGDEERDKPRNAFLITRKDSEGKIHYYYYVKVSDNDVKGESTYALTTPLGWKDKAVEYSATEDGLTMISAFEQDSVAASIRRKGKKKSTKSKKRNYDEKRRRSSESGNSSEEPNESSDDNETFKGFKVSYFSGAGYKEALELYPEIVNSKKFKDARASWLSSGKAKQSKKGTEKSKEQVSREKKGGNKSKDKFKLVESTSKNGTIAAEEIKCAQEFGAFTICITDRESSQFGKLIKDAVPESRLVSSLFDPANAYALASKIRMRLYGRKVKSIVLNLTGSNMNTLGKYTTQEDVDAYVLKVYQALKDKGIFVSKVVTTAQPGFPLASARAAMKLGYALEIHPTADYKVIGENGKAVSDKTAFLSNLGSASTKKDSRVYDKDEGPFITAKNEWTRDIAAKDKKTIYLFADNPERKSGFNRVPSSSRYSKKYGGRRLLSYPDDTSANIRGLENAFPISSEGRSDADIVEFRRTLSQEINDILEAMESGEYKRVVIPSVGIFGDISKEKTPKLYKELVKQLEYLKDSVEEIADSQVDKDADDKEYDSGLRTDSNDVLDGDEIRPLSIEDGKIVGSNVYVIDTNELSGRGISIYDSSGDNEITEPKLFVVISKDATAPSIEAWKNAKVYLNDGTRVTEDILFSLKGDSRQYNLLTETKGRLPLAVAQGLNMEVKLTTKVPYNKAGLVWLDDNNKPICK